MNPFACEPRRSCRPAPAILRLAVFVVPACILAPGVPLFPAENPLDLPVSGEGAGKARCPECEGTGKTPCETCSATGEIRRPCTLCKGSGRKPCPVCDDDRGIGRGRVECGLCRGQGVRGPLGKPCSRCQGARTVACLTCAARGTFSCRKYVVDKICPDCGFVGKVPCAACEGSGVLDPSAARSPRPARAEGSREGAPATPATAARPLEARYQAAVRVHEAHTDIFSDDLTPRINTLRAQASRLAKTLQGSGSSESEEALHQLGRFLQRADNFRRRFGELREEFVAALRSRKKLEGLRESRKAAVAGGSPAAREEAERKWTNRIDIALKVFERQTTDLSAEEPRWLLKEVEDLEAIWKDLNQKGTVLAAAVRVKPAASAPRPVPLPDSELELALATESEPGSESESGSEPDSESDSRSALLSPAASRQPPADPDSGSGSDSETAASPAGRRPPADPRSPWVPVAWAAVGFLAATLVFRARARRNGKGVEVEPERGRAVATSRRSSSP